MDSLKYSKIYADCIHRTGWYLVSVSEEASGFPFTHTLLCIQSMSVWMRGGNGNLLLTLFIPRGFLKVTSYTYAQGILSFTYMQGSNPDHRLVIKLERREMRSCFIWGNKSRSIAKESYLLWFLSRGDCSSIFYPHIELIENGSRSTILKINKERVQGKRPVYTKGGSRKI